MNVKLRFFLHFFEPTAFFPGPFPYIIHVGGGGGAAAQEWGRQAQSRGVHVIVGCCRPSIRYAQAAPRPWVIGRPFIAVTRRVADRQKLEVNGPPTVVAGARRRRPGGYGPRIIGQNGNIYSPI